MNIFTSKYLSAVTAGILKIEVIYLNAKQIGSLSDRLTRITIEYGFSLPISSTHPHFIVVGQPENNLCVDNLRFGLCLNVV